VDVADVASASAVCWYTLTDVWSLLSAEATANMSASEETLSWLLDIVENDPDPYVRSV